MAAELQRGGTLSEATILREVMNTVGKSGQLGESIRCVVSVSMLTEGWDANTVTHVLGCALSAPSCFASRSSVVPCGVSPDDLNEEGLFNVEYSDVLGFPLSSRHRLSSSKATKPRESVQVKAVRPDRDALEISFPRVVGYRVELPEEILTADFNEDSCLQLTPELVGPSITRNEASSARGVNLSLDHLDKVRENTILMHLTRHLLMHKFRDAGQELSSIFFGQLKRIAAQWLHQCFSCAGNTMPGQLLYRELADMACERITAAITPLAVIQESSRDGHPGCLQSAGLHAPRQLHHHQAQPLANRCPQMPRQLGGAGQRLGRGVLSRGGIHPPGARLCEESQPRL